MQKNFDNPKQQYEDCFFNDDHRYEKPYELFIVSKDGIRRKIDIRNMKKVNLAYDLNQCHRIDVEFPMIADFVPIKDAFNQMLLKPPQIYGDYKELEAVKEGKVDIDHCVKNYASPEILRGPNQRFCEKCQKLSDATRFYKLLKEPEILMCHIQRPADPDGKKPKNLKYDTKLKFGKIFNQNCDYPSSEGEFNLHIKKEGEEPQQPHLDPSDVPPVGKSKYSLQCVVTFNPQKSHYIAYARDDENKEWYRYDDNQVRQITNTYKEELVNTPHIYMLVYRKKKPEASKVGSKKK